MKVYALHLWFRNGGLTLTHLRSNFKVSMLDGDLFDKLARIGSILRKSTAPFGGIQVRNPAYRLYAQSKSLAGLR